MVARRETEACRRPWAPKPGGPRRVARPRTAHARLEDLADPVAIEQQRQAGDVVLVRMGQDDGIDPAVPWRDAPVEVDEQPVRVGTAIDQQATAAGTLDEDRVSLADVHDRDPGDTRWARRQHPAGDGR